ncbi:protein phosphatase 1 regulatory subunit 12b-like [Limosa lapponica baueri]|uniref:Protein phosphatase 1 regulatory subunit 12b-like n=1 Tax=Limosa lapponica baueri TaxID=1758121 RepID=A0A2I0T044_LIMLA|nr:protein phosphatase 1 regulatory subunit 12b-like [Limosa lapponica baueri]
MNGKPQSRLFTNKEKILYEEDTLKSMEMEEENKDSSSSSSEEEEEAEEDEVSESDAEKESVVKDILKVFLPVRMYRSWRALYWLY